MEGCGCTSQDPVRCLAHDLTVFGEGETRYPQFPQPAQTGEGFSPTKRQAPTTRQIRCTEPPFLAVIRMGIVSHPLPIWGRAQAIRCGYSSPTRGPINWAGRT